MFEQQRWLRLAWVPIAAGLAWLWCAASFGIPGCLLLAAGVSTLLWPDDVRIAQFVALGGFLGVPLALPAGPALHIRHAELGGLVHDEVQELHRVVSPLALEPKVAFEHRWIFGAVADRLVPSDQVRDLWRHWGRPRIVWYQGAHVTFGAHPQVGAMIEDALRACGLVAARA